MPIRVLSVGLLLASLLLAACSTQQQVADPAAADTAFIARLLDEAGKLRAESHYEASWAALELAIRIDPTHPLAMEMWDAAEQDRDKMVQQHLRFARSMQIERRYGEALLALAEAQHLEADNPAVEVLTEIFVDVINAQTFQVAGMRDSATTEWGDGMRWAWYDDPIGSTQEFEHSIERAIPQHRIESYCESQVAESVDTPIYVKSGSMPVFLRDEDAVMRGRLFEDDENLGQIKWYAFLFGSVHLEHLWAYVVWRDDGEDRWVLKRGLVTYDPAVSPATYDGATVINSSEDRYESVMIVTDG